MGGLGERELWNWNWRCLLARSRALTNIFQFSNNGEIHGRWKRSVRTLATMALCYRELELLDLLFDDA
ncbi:hypothetical protein Tco_0976909 [Tanacetum coccineum]|uniref:Uncharacterized protein n=1 Tax=Tanacetum coccineum TaxID=301880 RepID=A0ABQ5EJ26_9ASTR